MEHQIVLKIILTAVGLLTTAALTYTGRQIVKAVTTMKTVVTKVDGLAKQNEKQTENISTILRIQRPNIKAMRSISYALRECGANGSVTKALEHINTMEDELNATAEHNAFTAMGGK
jgi:hypothetical protein